MVGFAYNAQKSAANLRKHGIDFVDAQELWRDPDLVEVKARSEDEPRFLCIGRIGPKHWSAVITYRNGTVRIVSVRRSRRKEVEIYEGKGL